MLDLVLLTALPEESQRDKFEEIYYKYRNLLFTCAKNIVGNSADAEDVLQNSFIKIAAKLNCIEDIHSRETSAFLVVITKNAACDFLRKYNRNQEVPIYDFESLPYSDNTLEALTSRLDYEKIVCAIKKIPSPYSEVLFFHFVKDYSVKATADLLSRKVSTVKMQLVRGKKILLKKLEEVQYE